MLVVADTSPLSYLVRIGSVEILPAIYSSVVIPFEVRNELLAKDAPAIVREWASVPPGWVELRAPKRVLPNDPRLRGLDTGETAAIALALERRPSALLIDERRGSRVASQLGLSVTGTLGVLEEAARRGLISLPEVIERLRRTSFRYPKALVDQMLAEDARRGPGRYEL